MLDQMAAEGVATGAVAVREDVPTGMTVALSNGGDRAILTALGAVGSLTAADVPAGLLARARHVHLSGYFLVEDSLGPGLVAVMTAAQAAGATVSLDTNWDPSGRWGDDQLAAALARADLLLPNEAEAVRLSGEPDLSAAVPVLTAAGSRLVVKLGARGALCADGSRRHRVSVPPVVPVDATGAGDCFNAGLIAGLLRGLALPEAAALGCAAGALSTRAPGGTGSAPDLATALALAGEAAVTVPAAGTPAS
jgi:sugar/nucleoside kinase (ribokinase family)